MKTRVVSLAFCGMTVCGLVLFALTSSEPLAAQEGATAPGAVPETSPSRTVAAESDVEVQLVEIDVRVTDRKGRPVEGLEAGDFVLRVDDQTFPVEHFAAGRADSPTTASGGDSSGSARGELPLLGTAGSSDAESDTDLEAPGTRHLIVYLDQRFLDAAELEKARTQLLEFLRNDLPQGTRVMLATAADELQIVQGFTHEPALVADALQGLDVGRRGGVWRAQYDLVMQEVQRYHDMGSAASAEIVSLGRGVDPQAVRDGEFSLDDTNDPRELILEQGENKGPTELVESDPRYSLQMIDSFGQTVESGLAASASHMARLVSAASGLPGDKSVLYVGGTMPVNAAKTLFELWQDTYGDLANGGDWVARTASDLGWKSGVADASLESGERFSRAIERLGRVADVASASGVTFHTLDVSVGGRLGRGGGDVENYRSGAELRGGGRSNDTNLAARSDSGARLLADRTGGRSIANRNFELFFDGLAGDLASSYSLAFRLQPDDPEAVADDPEAMFHDVEVELTREAEKRLRKAGVRGAQTHHRRKVTVRTLEQEQVERTVSALAMNLEPVNPLEIEVLAGTPRPGDDGGLRVPLSVKVPMSKLALVPDRQAHAGRLSIYIAIGGLERGARLEKAVVPVRIANRDLLTAFGRTVDYRLEVSGPAAAERLAVTVRDDFRPARSTVTTRFGTWDDAPESGDAGSDAPVPATPVPATDEPIAPAAAPAGVPVGDPAGETAEGRL